MHMSIPPGTKLRIGISYKALQPGTPWLFRQDAGPPDEVHDLVIGGNWFMWEENHWLVVYGQGVIRLPSARGLSYIRYLLERRNQRVRVTELVEAANAAQREPVRTRSAEAVEAEEAGDAEEPRATRSNSIRTTATLGDAGAASDRKALRAYHDRIMRLTAGILEAEEDGDVGRAERLKLEKKQIRKQINADFDRRGRPRAERSARNRDRNSVSKAVKESINQIRAHHPELAAHLDASIQYGFECEYRSEEDPRWQFVW
jgi:hypothetical protein